MNRLSWFDHKIVIDRHMWRCGGFGPYHHGSMSTRMMDNHGMMCCLGKDAKDCGISQEILLASANPGLVASLTEDAIVKIPHMLLFRDGKYDNDHSNFACEMMTINDNEKLTDSRRELELFLCAKKHRVFVQFIGEYQDDRNCRADGPRRGSTC